MEIKTKYFSPNLTSYEKAGQTLNNWAESWIRPIDYSVEQCTQVFTTSSSKVYKIAVAILHTLIFPGTYALYEIGSLIDLIGESVKTRDYTYLPGGAKEKDPNLNTCFSLLSANLCMLPYGIWAWAGMRPAQERIDAIAQKILQENCDFICLQEMAPMYANSLWDKIQSQYAHGFSRIGPMPRNRMNGGLFFASKYPIEKTYYHPLPNKGPMTRGVFCAKTSIGWILTTHLKAGSSDSDVLLRKEQIASLQKLCKDLSEKGTIPCLLAMDANISRTGKADDEYTLSEIPKHFYNSFDDDQPFRLTPENATCTNIPALALAGKDPQDLEEAFEHIDYILSYKKNFTKPHLKAKQIPMFAVNENTALSDHKMLVAQGSILSFNQF